MSESTTIRWEQDETGVVTLILDDPNQSANTMNQAFKDSIAGVADRAEAEKDSIRGIIYTSAKKTFFAGGDLKDMIRLRPADARIAFDTGTEIKRSLRRIETLGKPVVAALNGTALGGGYEIALASHHRIALDAPGSKIGLPEVTLGLLPAGGGVTRTVRLMGIADALLKVLLQGTQYTPQRALDNGLVHELAATPEEMLAKARAFIDANPESKQPWDVPGYRIPGGTPSNPKFAANLPAFPASLKKQLNGAPLPGAAQHPGLRRRGLPGGLRDRADHRGPLLHRAGHRTDRQEHDPGVLLRPPGRQRRPQPPAGHRARTVRKVAVLGAGMMGAGIAYSCARAGIEVVLKDVTPEAAAKGKAYSEKLLDKALSRGPYHRGQARRAARPDHPDRRGRRPGGLRRRDRGRLRGHRPQAQGVPGDPGRHRAGRAALLQHLHAAHHRAGGGGFAPRRLHRSALLLARRQDAAGGDHQGRAHR
ncbi:hypothetical protein GCM10020254_19950 [Streptomyces goshikiensis]